MSKSIHSTVKSVFGGKSKTEIQRMIDENDPDLLELLRKKGFKYEVRDVRQLQALFDEASGDASESETGK